MPDTHSARDPLRGSMGRPRQPSFSARWIRRPADEGRL